MPATSQKQQKFMNFVHAVQKGEASAKGYPKVQEASKEMKPSSVEHFMGRGHIDKKLPKTHHKKAECNCGGKCKACKAAAMKKTAFDRGFFKAAVDAGIEPLNAVQLLKSAFDIQDIISKHPELAGALAGGLGGAGVGALSSSEHKGRNALLGGLTGAGLGAGAGHMMHGHPAVPVKPHKQDIKALAELYDLQHPKSHPFSDAYNYIKDVGHEASDIASDKIAPFLVPNESNEAAARADWIMQHLNKQHQ